ncbi:transmembrane protein 14C-like [Paramacrobiotus metropolitanus]|uniref:transmembrane protein 14C-like n=1 Tax=Paramacrobiotus metropolitanus TaxID=2943436 RepID=UPI0024458F79|nr:transmembrane protein 14C-like [Paramacrobiotus metropolitanus]
MPPVAPVSPDYLGFLYAAVVAAGGLAGYAKKKSIVSLIMGLLFGALLGLGSYLTSYDYGNVLVSTAASGLLTAIMGLRFNKSGKFMPAGMVCLISLLMLVRYGIRLV